MRWPSVLSAAALAGCGWFQGPPVPVAGDLQLLVGEWSGDYSSRETGRTGSILFRLEAGKDTATGDVLMVPNREAPATAPARSLEDPGYPRPRPLNISFVRCASGQVTGRLDPYPDPETGERVLTTFDGRVKGDLLEGTFVSYFEPSGRRAEGRWSVKRSLVRTPRS